MFIILLLIPNNKIFPNGVVYILSFEKNQQVQALDVMQYLLWESLSLISKLWILLNNQLKYSIHLSDERLMFCLSFSEKFFPMYEDN